MTTAHTATHTVDKKRVIVPKPAKPWKDFPLYWHPRGYWMCRRDKQDWLYEADADKSYARYVTDESNRAKGIRATPTMKRYTLKDAVNQYLTRQKRRHDDGELSDVQFTKCRLELEIHLKKAVKFSTPLEALRSVAPDDHTPAVIFKRIRSAALARGLNAAHRHITLVRAMLDYAQVKKLMVAPDYGDDFDPPSQSRINRARHELDQRLGERAWTIDELRKMLAEAQKLAVGRVSKKSGQIVDWNPHLYAQILLGLFGGLGSDDLSVLPESAIDRTRMIIKHIRAKNGRPGMCAIPNVVYDAVDVSIAARAKPANADSERLLFLTNGGMRCNIAARKMDENGVLLSVGRNDTIGKNFQRFIKRIGLARPRTGFKSLRAMCRTIMTGTQVDEDIRAVIMGRPLRFPVDDFYLRGDLREKLFFARDVIHNQLFPKQTQ